MQWLKNALVFSAIISLCYIETKAQNAEKLLEDFLAKMAEIKSGELRYTVATKSFLKQDTLLTNVNLTFVNPKNTDSFLLRAEIADKPILIYDLEHFYRVSDKRKELMVERYNWEQVYRTLHNNNYIPITSQGRNLLKYTLTGKLRTKDTLVNNKSYKLLHLYKPFSDFDSSFTNMNLFYFLNPKNLLPEKYIYTIEGLGGTQYVELNLLDRKLNHFTEEAFRKVLHKQLVKYQKDYKLIQSPTHADISKIALDSGKVAPDFSLKRYAGDSVVFPISSAKVYLLDFWYVRCYPCQLAIPHIQKLYVDYAKNGLEIIGINTQIDDTALLPALVQRLKITYPIALNGKPVAEKYGVKAYPTLFLVNREGKIIYRSVGFSEDAMKEMQAIIQRELNSIKN